MVQIIKVGPLNFLPLVLSTLPHFHLEKRLGAVLKQCWLLRLGACVFINLRSVFLHCRGRRTTGVREIFFLLSRFLDLSHLIVSKWHCRTCLAKRPGSDHRWHCWCNQYMFGCLTKSDWNVAGEHLCFSIFFLIHYIVRSFFGQRPLQIASMCVLLKHTLPYPFCWWGTFLSVTVGASVRACVGLLLLAVALLGDVNSQLWLHSTLFFKIIFVGVWL